MSGVLYQQAFPGRGEPPERNGPSEPVPALTSTSRLFAIAAAERASTTIETFGALAWQLVDGASTVGSGLVVPDERAKERLSPWCADQRVLTPAGPLPWTCETLAEFLDPFVGLFIKITYRRGAALVAPDMGRFLGLLTEHWTPGRGSFTGGFTLWPYGWSEVHMGADGRRRRRSVSPHVAPIRGIASTTTSYRVEYGRPPGGPGCGKRNLDGSHYRGRFYDPIAASCPLDGIESADLADHTEAFRLGRVELPAAVPVDVAGADQLARTMSRVRALAEIVDDDRRKWLTTPKERRERVGRVDLRFTPTAGSLAARIDERSGAPPMLWRPGAPDDEAMDLWTPTHKGGWLSAELAGGGLFPAADIDMHAGYPAVDQLLGLDSLRTAASFEEEDVTDDLRALLVDLAAGNVDALFDRETWRRFGATNCGVLCHGEDWPVEAPDADFPAGHSAMRPFSSTVVLPFHWCDLALATLRARRVVDLPWAKRLVGVGQDAGLRARWPLYAGTWMRRGQSVGATLVRLRREAKARGDHRLAALLRVVVNAYVYGNAARIDQRSVRKGRRYVLAEQVARGTFPPIAASITAGCRLVIGVNEHLGVKSGGTVASRDTDGVLWVCSPDGGVVELDDGRQVPALSWAALDEIMARFDALAPFGPGVPFFKPPLREKDGRPLWGVVLRVKRYALATLDDDGDPHELVDATEHGLAGQVVDPAAMPGRAKDGRRDWTRAVAAETVGQAIARRRGERRVVDLWPWDEGAAKPFPQIQRCQAPDPAVLENIEGTYGLRLRPFGLYLLGTSQPELGQRHAPPLAALDPGGTLEDWDTRIEWHDQDARRVPVTTDPAMRHRAHELRTLDERAIAWMKPRPLPVTPVVVDDPRMIRPVGRGGRLVEARAAGDHDTPSEELRVTYAGPDVRPVIVERVKSMGPTNFAESFDVPARTAKAWAAGERKPSAGWVERLLPLLGNRSSRLCGCNCGEIIVGRATRRFVNDAHRKRAARGSKS